MGLYKRGSVWWIRISVNGKQVRLSTDAEDKKIAQRVYAKVKGQIAEGKWFDKLPDRTFKEMMVRFEEEHISRKSSPRQYRGWVKNLLPFFGDCIVSKITPSMIVDYKAKRRQDGVSPATINRELAAMKHAYNLAIKEWGWANNNPVSKVRMEKEPKGRVRYLSGEESTKLLDACPSYLKPIVLTAMHTGLRKGNILALKWSDIDLRRKVISVEHTKNDERHSIPINVTLLSMFKSLPRHIQSPYVFHNVDGSKYGDIKIGFAAALKRAGIQDFRFHDLRHCFASALVQQGVDLYLVQRLLGHKTSSMTQRYAHLCPENLRAAVHRLDSTNLAHLGGSSPPVPVEPTDGFEAPKPQKPNSLVDLSNTAKYGIGM